jgi:hypothetical protein
MNTQHTPAPWKVNEELDSYVISDCSEEGLFISRVWKHWHNSEANARLIAAAPELLEALENLMEWCAWNVNVAHFPEYDIAFKVIAKATGKKEGI